MTQETIRQNPIPAAMAGIGIGWLVMNRRRPQTWSGSWSSSNRWNRDELGGYGQGSNAGRRPTGSGFAETLGDRTDRAGQAVADAAAGARRSAAEVADDLGETAGQAIDTVGRTTTDVVTQAQDAIESNPLAFGAIAVAVGAAIGLAIPATTTERRVMGDAGGQLIDKVESAVSQPLERMESAGSR